MPQAIASGEPNLSVIKPGTKGLMEFATMLSNKLARNDRNSAVKLTWCTGPDDYAPSAALREPRRHSADMQL
jgi:hypothetical protein